MANWNYTIRKGKALREAIYAEDIEQVVKCLLECYKELLKKLSDEDRDWKGFDIEDAIGILTDYEADDEDNVNYHLEEFYAICDSIGVWIAI